MDKYAAAEFAYKNGFEAGSQSALLRVQSCLHAVALRTTANNNESRYENFVVMLSDVDKVIEELLLNPKT